MKNQQAQQKVVLYVLFIHQIFNENLHNLDNFLPLSGELHIFCGSAEIFFVGRVWISWNDLLYIYLS